MFFDDAPEIPDLPALRAAARPRFTCGHCRGTHTAVAIARACAQGWEVTPAAEISGSGCGWIIPNAYLDFDGMPVAGECGAEIAYGPDAWVCADGHEHVGMETREREGWDYAADAYDAAVIGRGGREFRPAGPGTSIDPAEMTHIAAHLL